MNNSNTFTLGITLFILGALFVFIGAFMKITHSELGGVTPNLMLTISMAVEFIALIILGIGKYSNRKNT